MIKKLIIFFIIGISLTSCGYAPIYSDKNATNFEISSFKIEGNNEVNNIVKNNINKYFNTDSEKKYIISIKTNYEKSSAVKDATGKTTSFKLIVNLDLKYTKLDTEKDNKEKLIRFTENQIIKRDENNYEQNNYENILIKNMSELITNKVILHLARS